MENNPTKEERERLNQQKIEDRVNSEKRKKLTKKIVIYGILVLIVAAIIYIPLSNSNKPGKYDDFAKCLTEKGAEFYGAYWCSHCADQKKLFGKSIEYVNYIECDARGSNAQPSLCAEKGVKGYPTWIINNKTFEGVQSLEELSKETGCILPQ